MDEESWRPPEWMFRKKRPPNDDAYFENMCRVIFQAGLNWNVIEKKWPNFRKAFHHFSTDNVAKFDNSDVEHLMRNEGIVRNRAKIEAVIQNAAHMKDIKKRFGSFQSYLDSLDKSSNYASAIEELGKQFKRLGPSSAGLFLYAVGENVKHSEM
jgi:DNA-3-methyladenine glycosylase I